jgi:hypothetical protein
MPTPLRYKRLDVIEDLRARVLAGGTSHTDAHSAVAQKLSAAALCQQAPTAPAG